MNGDPSYTSILRRCFDGVRPTPPRKGTGSWALTTVHPMLRRERYKGVIAFGRSRKAYRAGTKARTHAPEDQVLRVKRPDLRIIDEPLWNAVQERLDQATLFFALVRDVQQQGLDRELAQLLGPGLREMLLKAELPRGH